jgi:serine protease inhibitor
LSPTLDLLLIAASSRVDEIRKEKTKRNKQSFKYYIGQMQEFSGDMYAELSKEKPDENLIFSPYSIESALMMTAIGAKGKTWNQIRSGMRMGRNRQLRNNTKRFRSRMER